MHIKQKELDALRKKMSQADLLLKASAHHLVFGEGDPDADIILVGEAPGKNEDLTGLPFIGSAGKILDQLLNSIELERKDIFITSILKYRPPNNRNPQLDEIINHTPYLIDQIRIIKPRVIVPLGNFATRFILNGFNVANMQQVAGISKLHGKVEIIHFEDQQFSVMPLYHPAAVLYNGSLRKTLDQDFQAIKTFVNSGHENEN